MTHIRNRYFLVIDLFCIACMPLLALLLRVDPANFRSFVTVDLWIFSGLALLLKPIIFYYFGLYARYWRFASVEDMLHIFWGAGTTTVMMFAWVILEKRLDFIAGYGVPVSLPLLDGILTLLAVAGTRFSVRALANYKSHKASKGSIVNTLIIGAGETGVMLLRSMKFNPESPLRPIGFLDDDLRKKQMTIGGAKILGTLNDLSEVVPAYNVQEVILAIPSASGDTVKQVFENCEELDVPVKTVPSLDDIINGNVNINALRDVNIEDLLRRDPVKIDNRNVRTMLQDTRVLVTGAGGSIGSELCRQIAHCNPARLILLGHGENSLFNIQNELIKNHPSVSLDVFVADMRDRSRLEQLFKTFHPEVIFHAAAHKHVPMMESNIPEAVTNNILGTRNLVDLAKQFSVERFVTISSDKAVNPTNVMGATKRVTELMVREMGIQQDKPFVSVRFGNVLGSRGSVVPFFRKQIAQGGPVTVTHKDMTRYFMTIPEATQLVLQAGAMGMPGDVFVLDMGTPIKIVDLARDMIELSGKRVGEDIQIVFSGLRPGEKMHEELFGGEENPSPTEHKKIMRSPNQSVDSNLQADLDELIAFAKKGQDNAVIQGLQKLVPGFQRS